MDDDHREHLIKMCNDEGGGSTFVLDTSGGTPSYMITYGWSFHDDLPEFIMLGDGLMMAEWNRIYNELIEATTPPPQIEGLHRWPIEFNGHPIVSRQVHPSNVTEEWFEDPMECRRLAGLSGLTSVHQLFWADGDGNMPWDDGPFATTQRWLQPPLYQPDVKRGDPRPRLEGLRHRAEVLILCQS